MPKFKLIAEWDTDTKVEHTFEVEVLDDVVMHAEHFLRGCGYFYEGDLGIIEKEQTAPAPETITLDLSDYGNPWEGVILEEWSPTLSTNDDLIILDTTQHNDYFYDKDRNR